MPRQFRRLSHSVYECKYHIVFCPKYRYKPDAARLQELVQRIFLILGVYTLSQYIAVFIC